METPTESPEEDEVVVWHRAVTGISRTALSIPGNNNNSSSSSSSNSSFPSAVAHFEVAAALCLVDLRMGYRTITKTNIRAATLILSLAVEEAPARSQVVVASSIPM